MTGQELYENSLALLALQPDEVPEYGAYALPIINLLLAETAGVNDGLRFEKGLSTYDGIPAIKALSDTLPCEDELCLRALPYGLCAKLLPDEDDMQKTAYFQNLYIMALDDLKRCELGFILDIYRGGSVR